MMKHVSFFICCLLCFCHLWGQNKNWTVKAGEEINESVPADVKFLYPAFVTGNVYFKDGTASAAQLDFNLLNEEMQFISPNGDTLSLANEATIRYITINTDSFYYFKGYLKLISSTPSVKLAKRQRIKIGDVKKVGGYDQASSTSAITSYNSVYNNSGVQKINPRAELLLSKETVYYIGDNYNHFAEASKRNVIKMYGIQETSIENFLKKNKTRFNNEEDLKKLIIFIQQDK